MHRKAEEESHSGVLWATTRTQRSACPYVKRRCALAFERPVTPDTGSVSGVAAYRPRSVLAADQSAAALVQSPHESLAVRRTPR